MKIDSPRVKVTAVDTIGAGDCFYTGFLYSHLRGGSLQESLGIGNICGAISTTAYGTVATPTEAEILGHLASVNEGADVAERNSF